MTRPQELPEALIAGRRDRLRLLRALVVALIVAGAAWLAGLPVTITIAASLGTVALTFWLLRRWSAWQDTTDGRRAERLQRQIDATEAPDGDRVYTLRPRAVAAVVLTGSAVVAGVLFHRPALLSTEVGAYSALSAALLGSLTVATFVKAAILRQ